MYRIAIIVNSFGRKSPLKISFIRNGGKSLYLPLKTKANSKLEVSEHRSLVFLYSTGVLMGPSALQTSPNPLVISAMFSCPLRMQLPAKKALVGLARRLRICKVLELKHGSREPWYSNITNHTLRDTLPQYILIYKVLLYKWAKTHKHPWYYFKSYISSILVLTFIYLLTVWGSAGIGLWKSGDSFQSAFPIFLHLSSGNRTQAWRWAPIPYLLSHLPTQISL